MAASNFQVLTDDQKEEIQKLIVEGLQFPEMKEEFLCSNCQLVPIYNYVFPCNHPYCKDCFNFFVKSKRKCRKCNSACGLEKKQSKDLEKSIYTLKSICPNKTYGCEQQIELKNLLIHLDKCQFTKERTLPKIYDQSKDQGDQINRDIEELKKSVSETQQLNENLFKKVEQLTEQCKVQAAGYNETNAKFEKENQKMNDEMKKYKNLLELSDGKYVKLETEIVQQNDKANTKLDKMAEQMLKLEMTLGEMKEGEVKDKTNSVNLLKEEPLKVSRNAWNNLNFNDQEGLKTKIKEIRSLKNGTVLWQIENYEKKKKEESIEFSEEFYTSENGFKMRMKIRFGYGFIQPSIEILPGELDRLLPPLIHFRATVSILDQSGRSQKRDRVRVNEPHFGKDAEKFLKNDNFFWLILSETEEKEIYLKNDKILIKAEIEPITSLFRNYFSNDGILIWNIDNYERTKRESIKTINDEIYSDYFYSSESGFRMKARVEFNKENIYFYLLFLVGEFDFKLAFYFNHECTIVLINQKQSIPSKDLVIGSEKLDSASDGEDRVRTEMSSYYYCHRIEISPSKVEKEPYLINDKIIVKFVVEAL